MVKLAKSSLRLYWGSDQVTMIGHVSYVAPTGERECARAQKRERESARESARERETERGRENHTSSLRPHALVA
jgi:hypothetical protein